MVKSNFLKRTLTGIVFVAILVGCILFNPLSFTILFVLVSALTIREFGQLVNKSGNVDVNKTITMLGGAYLFFAFTYFCLNGKAEAFIPYLFLLLYLMISELYLKKEHPVNNWAYSMFSQCYIALPFAMLNILAFHTDNNMDYQSISYNPILPLSIFVFIWVNDTGAYCVGSLLGKHRLFERISPKKSWEGSIGGAIFVIAAGCIFAYFFPFMVFLKWIGLALVVVVFGTWGDLTESLFKRKLGIKDSGTLLPGHGGMLDRFDSALMAIPAAVIYLYTFTLF